jgi:hypothetical protein
MPSMAGGIAMLVYGLGMAAGYGSKSVEGALKAPEEPTKGQLSRNFRASARQGRIS